MIKVDYNYHYAPREKRNVGDTFWVTVGVQFNYFEEKISKISIWGQGMT